MKRLTYDFELGGKHCWQVEGADNLECREVCERQEDTGCKTCPIAKAFDRLAAIEDILGDEYELERLKLLLDNDKSCYTCRNYKGEKKCGFKGLDVEINPQEGCSVREAALRREQDG